MEQKKILWILFSVTLFFLVVVGAGFIWFYPGAEEPQRQTAETELTEETAETEDFDPIEWVRSSEDYPGLREEEKKGDEEESFVVVYGEEDGELDEGVPKVAEEGRQAPAEERAEQPAAGAAKQAAEKERKEAEAEKARTVRKEKQEQQPAAAEREEKRYEGTKKTIRTVEYWIQAGSYTSKTRAEQVRGELAEKGFTSRITVKEVEGTRYYRVRIGPYREKAEADKFLRWVREIDKFEKSYISRVYRKKRVAD
jgi:cell division protein FtsN